MMVKSNVKGYLCRKSGYWYLVIRYRARGVTHQYMKGTHVRVGDTRRKAEDLLHKELRNIAEENRVIEQLMLWHIDPEIRYRSVSAYFEYWMEQQNMTLSKQSFYTYRSMLRQAGTFLDQQTSEVALLTLSHMEAYFAQLRAWGRKPRTIQNHMKILRQVFDDAFDHGIIKIHPMVGIPLEQGRSDVPEPYSEKELEQLLTAAHETELEPAIYLAAFYGLRCGEICGLRWKDVDFENKMLHIRCNVVRACREDIWEDALEQNANMKTPASRRSFPLHPNVERVLLQHREQQSIMTGNVFVSKRGGLMNPSCLSKAFQKFLRQRGLRKVRLHDLRHTCATLLVKNGCDLQEAQAYLGHANIASTLVYIHLDSNCNQVPCQKMENLLQRVV